MENLIKLVFIGVVVAGVFMIGPWAFLWGINTLISAAMVGAPAGAFVPQIAFGFWTWLAALVVGGLALIPSARRG